MSIDIDQYPSLRKRIAKRESGCWDWTGAEWSGGYGKFQLNGKVHLAHRYSYWTSNGPLPINSVVRHICDNPKCVNPRHLVIGSQVDNVKDRVDRDRSAYGEKNGRAKLTWDTVRAIRAFCLGEKRGAPVRASVEFGVNIAIVRDILKNKTWKERYD